MILLADIEGPDQTARLRRLIWAFAVSICPKTTFHMAWSTWWSRQRHKCCKVRKRPFGHTRPVKYQTSLHIRVNWAESSLGAFMTAKVFTCGQRKLWSDRAYAQADLSLYCQVHMIEGTFSLPASHTVLSYFSGILSLPLPVINLC